MINNLEIKKAEQAKKPMTEKTKAFFKKVLIYVLS